MDDPIKLADNIAASITESSAYKDFVRAKKDVMNNDVLREKMKKFKKAHNEFCERKAAGSDISLYDEINVSRMYFELMNSKDSKDYLNNEQILIKLMAQVYEHLTNSCAELFTGFEG